jgi:hypothetical protein
MSLHAANANIIASNANATAVKGALSKNDPAIAPYMQATDANNQIYFILQYSLFSNNALSQTKGQQEQIRKN